MEIKSLVPDTKAAEPKKKKERSKIAENCYLHTSCDNNTKRSILNYLFKEQNIPTGVLEFELAPIADKVIDTEDE